MRFAQLVRLPNLFTSLSNVLAAMIISQEKIFISIALASVFAYAGGTSLNDYCDRHIDKKNNPDRPIPKGLIKPRTALFLSIALLISTTISAAFAGILPFLFALGLVICIIAYNTLLKSTDLTASIGMGGCRGFNWMMGLGTSYLYIALIYAFYIAFITKLARYEHLDKSIKKMVITALTIIPIIDGAIVAAFGHFYKGIMVAALIFPVLILRKYLYMT